MDAIEIPCFSGLRGEAMMKLEFRGEDATRLDATWIRGSESDVGEDVLSNLGRFERLRTETRARRVRAFY